MKQKAIKTQETTGAGRLYGALAIIVGCAAVLAWLYWPARTPATAATPDIQERADLIAEQIRKTEPPPDAPPPPPQAERRGGPEDMRVKVREGSGSPGGPGDE